MDRRDKAGIVKVMLTITPAHWLLQAQQSRMLAEATTDPEARETLLEIAGCTRNWAASPLTRKTPR
jgi:hypothetical protein